MRRREPAARLGAAVARRLALRRGAPRWRRLAVPPAERGRAEQPAEWRLARSRQAASPRQALAVVAADAGARRARRQEPWPASAISANWRVRPTPPRSTSTSTSAPRLRGRDSATALPSPLRAQTRGALLDDGARDLRHARGRRAGARREGEDVQIGEPAVVDDAAASCANISSLSVGKPAMRSAPKTTSGPQPAHFLAERYRIGAAVAALHALQDHVVACLHGEMQVRHQPLLFGDRVHQRARPPRPGRWRRAAAARARARAAGSGARAPPSVGVARQVRAVGGDVDAGQHDLAATAFDEPPDLRDHLASRHRARWTAPERNDAECAAMVAAVLDLHVRRACASRSRRSGDGRLAHAHDVVDLHALAARGGEPRQRSRRFIFSALPMT